MSSGSPVQESGAGCPMHCGGMADPGPAAAQPGAAAVHVCPAPVQHDLPGRHRQAGTAVHHQSCPHLPGGSEEQLRHQAEIHGSFRVSYWYAVHWFPCHPCFVVVAVCGHLYCFVL